jgi:hypothetical protein
MSSNRLDNYLALLVIRRAGARRDTFILGALFFVLFISLITFGMLDQLNGRAMYLGLALIAVQALGYLTSRMKLEIIKETIELINNLRPMGDE